MNQPNARFWTYVNGGWVKLTLEPGQFFEWHEGGPTDEGWDWTTHTWQSIGEYVSHITARNACDCDGRMEWANRYRAHVLALRNHLPYTPALFPLGDNKPLLVPRWETISRSQRDHEAEKAGY